MGVKGTYFGMQANSVARYSTEALKSRRDIGDAEHFILINFRQTIPKSLCANQGRGKLIQNINIESSPLTVKLQATSYCGMGGREE